MIGRYQGNVAAAKRSWASAHEKDVIGFIRAYVAAIDWLYEAANREEAVHVLTEASTANAARACTNRATICCSTATEDFSATERSTWTA